MRLAGSPKLGEPVASTANTPPPVPWYRRRWVRVLVSLGAGLTSALLCDQLPGSIAPSVCKTALDVSHYL